MNDPPRDHRKHQESSGLRHAIAPDRLGTGGIRPARRLRPKGARSDRMAAQGRRMPPQEKRVVRGKGRIPTSRAIRTGHGNFPSYNCFYYIKLCRAVMTKKAATGRFPANRECRKMHFPRAGRVSSRCPWIKTLVQNVARRWTNVSACRSGHTGWVDGGTSPRRTLKAQDAHHGYGQHFGSGIHPSADQDR